MTHRFLRTTSIRGAQTIARRSAIAVAAVCVAIFALAAPASAGPGRLGPSVSIYLYLKDGELSINSASLVSSLFEGKVTLSATRGSVEWTPFDEPATVQNGGSQLVQSGTIGGVPLDEYFAFAQVRRLRIRNGDGGITELDVFCNRGFLRVTRANRNPEATVTTSTPSSGSASFDAPASGVVKVKLAPGAVTGEGMDVVVAATLEPASGSAGRAPELVATDLASSTQTVGEWVGAENPDVGFYHFTLAAGTYRITGHDTLTTSDLASGISTSIGADLGEVATISVSRSERLFAITIPAPAAPELVDAAVTLGGLEGFEPTFADRISLVVTLVRDDGNVRISSYHDVGDPSPILMPLSLPPGRYEATLRAGRSSRDVNGTGYFADLSLGSVDVAPEMSIAVPPLVALTGSVLDPALTLTTIPSQGPNGVLFNEVTARGGEFTASATLSGFARSFKIYVPRDRELNVGASLIAALGKPFRRRPFSKNDTGMLRFAPDSHPVVCNDGGCDVDLTVPALDRAVTVVGEVVDASGRGVPGAVVTVTLDAVPGDDTVSFDVSLVTGGGGQFQVRVPRGYGYRVSAIEN